MTAYVVLVKVEGRDHGGWHELLDESVEAHNDRVAIREALRVKGVTDAEQRSGEYVAVPARSWQPRVLEVTTREIERWA